ncbi:amino acid permease [Desulfotomaculum copahuensis]|uniref:Amino acid permease/ SLC12A domain-containing protein n=1 Tax=Desulfotomaculum copahuensis TaxID=1838280 RepID=A0A1B7LKJ5_9FIRM|nr:amino acid permease [Desulfotomaculum copahuensis]OAT87078.1 hypothetical protein A6M21_01955 [Desulfotomaculum copahuensis]
MAELKAGGQKMKTPSWQAMTGRKTLHGRRDGKKQLGLLELIMMGLGGAIGSGIFVASGIPIHLAGPGVALVFLAGGLITALVTMMLAEMGVADPERGSFSAYADKYLGRPAGFVSGWMYWTSGILTMATEMVAAALLARFWLPHWPVWLFSLIFATLVTGLNLLDVRSLSRVEEWLAFVKAGMLALFIIAGAAVLLGFWPGHPSPGLSNYFGHGGFFPTGPHGPLASLLLVMFAYAGVQVIGLAMADTNNPEQTVPRSIPVINTVLPVLYVGAMLVLTGLTDWSAVKTDGIPFIPVIQSLGIPGAAGLINAVILSAVISAMNSNMYGVPRMLNSLSQRRDAPAFLGRPDRRGVPVYAVLVSAVFLLLIAGLAYLLPEQIFVYVASAGGVTSLFNWVITGFTHLRFRSHPQRQKDARRLRYAGFPYTTWTAIVLLLVVLGTAALSRGQLAGLISGLVLLVLYVAAFYLLRHFSPLNDPHAVRRRD